MSYLVRPSFFSIILDLIADNKTDEELLEIESERYNIINFLGMS